MAEQVEPRLIAVNNTLYTPLRSFGLTTYIDESRGSNTSAADARPTLEYLRIRVRLRTSSGIDGRVRVLDPLISMIDRILITRSGFGIEKGTETSVMYRGNHMYLLSYLKEEPDQGVILGADGSSDTTVDMPYVLMSSREVHVYISFRADLNPYLDVVEVTLWGVPASIAYRVAGTTTSMPLVPLGSTFTQIRESRVLCCFIWYGKGCRASDVQLELRDGPLPICAYGDANWIIRDLREASEDVPAECIAMCRLPWLNTTEHLRLHVKTCAAEVIRTAEVTWIALHAPETEGWVWMDANGPSASRNGTRGAAWRNYIASWMAIPTWAKRKAIASATRQAIRALPPPPPLPRVSTCPNLAIPTTQGAADTIGDESWAVDSAIPIGPYSDSTNRPGPGLSAIADAASQPYEPVRYWRTPDGQLTDMEEIPLPPRLRPVLGGVDIPVLRQS